MRTSKVLRNLNRGFLLSAAIVLGVVIFLILQGQADDKLEPELKTMAEDFIADSDTVVVLPEEYRVFDGPNLAIDAFGSIFESSSENNQFYSDNPSLRKSTLSWLQNCLLNQAGTRNYITSLKTEIIKFNSFSVYKGKATLSFEVLCNGETISVNGATTIGPAKETETLTFEKENGEWVITNYRTNRFESLLYNMDGGEIAW